MVLQVYLSALLALVFVAILALHKVVHDIPGEPFSIIEGDIHIDLLAVLLGLDMP